MIETGLTEKQAATIKRQRALTKYIMTSLKDYYENNRSLLNQTLDSSVTLIKRLLDVNNIAYLSVNGRVKSLESFIEKSNRKKYKDAIKSTTDLVGLRIILYFEHQFEIVDKIIKDNFVIDLENSSSKDKELGYDKIGYRSLHLICSFDEKRKVLREYSEISNFKFEVQIRTVLQHAWAELAHDRAYKFSGGLPPKIQREVNLYAGMLEIADAAFSRIAIETENYKTNLEGRDINEEPISVLSLLGFMDAISAKLKVNIKDTPPLDGKIVQEIKDFGIEKIGDLENLFTDEFCENMRIYQPEHTYWGLLRDSMLWNDAERYFSKSWNRAWSVIDRDGVEAIMNKNKNFKKILSKYEIEIDDTPD